jgi:elongation factor G
MDSIRNITLVGHGNSGKTALAESMLFHAKVITRMGTVQDGTTVSDFTDIEKERGNSLTASVMHYEWKKTLTNIIDTPGYSDFFGEAISGICAADVVVVAVAANNGIQVNTRNTWKKALECGKPLAVVVTKLDSENIDFSATLSDIEQAFGSQCKAVTSPVNEGPGITGVEDILTSGSDLREGLVETLVETNDELMEKYLEGVEISADELAEAFRTAMAQSAFVPVFAICAPKGLGVEEFMNTIATNFPSPGEISSFHVDPGEEEAQGDLLTSAAQGGFVAQVFKSVTDDYVGKLNYFRVVRGAADSDSSVILSSTGKKVRLQNIFRLQGKEQLPVTELSPGNIYAVSKIEDLSISDTLHSPQEPVKLTPMVFPEPMVFVAISPRSRQDEQRISAALAKLSGEDPTFKVGRNIETKELVATGMSQLHLDIKFKTLKSRFNVEVDTRPPRIPYRETITAKAQARYRHKKQTGGAGQFAEVWLRVEPLQTEEGSYTGFDFASKVFGGAISQSFIPSIEKGIKAVLLEGVIAGYPIDGVKAEVYDGKEHPVDSKDIAFQIAGREAFKLCIKDAKPVMLEPIMDVEVSVPSEFMGEVTGDLNTRRGRIQGMEADGLWQVISAKVPQAELMSYSTDLRSVTGGEASFTMKFSHYDMVPSNITANIIARAAKKDETSDK